MQAAYAPLLCTSALHRPSLRPLLQAPVCISSFDPFPAASGAWGRRGGCSEGSDAVPAVHEVTEAEFEVQVALRLLRPRTVKSRAPHCEEQDPFACGLLGLVRACRT